MMGVIVAGLLGIAWATAPPKWPAEEVNRAGQTDEIAEGAKGPPVLRAQILLARAHFSPGEIDGHFGPNLRRALTAFQQDRGLSPSGKLDQPTWKALDADTAPALVEYVVAKEDVAGPFTPLPEDLLKQAKLPSLGYSSAQEELGERFHSAPELLQALNPGKDLARTGEPILVPNVLVMPPQGPAARVEVSRSESSVRAYDASGKLLGFWVASSGSEHDPLPIGEWKITGVKRNPPFYYDSQLFWDAKHANAKAKIAPGPNNPVGVAWIDLSKEHYGIHGTPAPGKVGHTQSHGCIRLTNWDVTELAGLVKPNTPALLKE